MTECKGSFNAALLIDLDLNDDDVFKISVNESLKLGVAPCKLAEAAGVPVSTIGLWVDGRGAPHAPGREKVKQFIIHSLS